MKMKNLLFCSFMMIVSLATNIYANIDERKSDIYFANGINTSADSARDAANRLILPAVVDDIYSGNLILTMEHIGKFDYVYNSTHGTIADLYSLVPTVSVGMHMRSKK